MTTNISDIDPAVAWLEAFARLAESIRPIGEWGSFRRPIFSLKSLDDSGPPMIVTTEDYHQPDLWWL